MEPIMTDNTAIERQRRFGCIPDHPDFRDLMFAPPPQPLPAKVDLSGILPPVLDQGQIGSCTGHGSSEAVRAALIKAGCRSTSPRSSRRSPPGFR
jgi:hypothetical protein